MEKVDLIALELGEVFSSHGLEPSPVTVSTLLSTAVAMSRSAGMSRSELADCIAEALGEDELDSGVFGPTGEREDWIEDEEDEEDVARDNVETDDGEEEDEPDESDPFGSES